MAKKAAAKSTAAKPMSKTDLLNTLAEATQLTRKQVGGVLEALEELIGKQLSKKGPRVVALPGLVKIMVQHKPASGPKPVRNPATGEMVMSKAKPARDVVKVRALKKLKDMV